MNDEYLWNLMTRYPRKQSHSFFCIWIFSPSKPPQNKPPQTIKDEGLSTFHFNSSSWNHSTNAPRFACKNVMFMNNVASGRCARLGKGFGKGRLMKGEVNQKIYCDICTTYTEYMLCTCIYIFYKRCYSHMIYEHLYYIIIYDLYTRHIYLLRFSTKSCNYASTATTHHRETPGSKWMPPVHCSVVCNQNIQTKKVWKSSFQQLSNQRHFQQIHHAMFFFWRAWRWLALRKKSFFHFWGIFGRSADEMMNPNLEFPITLTWHEVMQDFDGCWSERSTVGRFFFLLISLHPGTKEHSWLES